MSQQGKRRALWVVVAAAALAAGCMPPTRTEFIERLAAENRKVARSARQFRSSFMNLAAGQAVDPGAVHTAYDGMVKTVQEVQADMKHQMLPPASEHAKDFLDAYRAYLDSDQAILDGPLKQITAIIDDNSTAPADKWDAVKAQMQQVVAMEGGENDRSTPLGKLMYEEQQYTSDHNYQAIKLADYITAAKNGK